MRARWHADVRQGRECQPVVHVGGRVEPVHVPTVRPSLRWSDIDEQFSRREDIADEVLDRCPRLTVTPEAVEWIRLYRDAQAGALPDYRTPLYRRTMEALRIEDAVQSQTDRDRREAER